MDMEFAFLQALHDRPGDEASWLVLADWLEDQGRAAQGELTRLHVQLRRPLDDRERMPLEERACLLLEQGARPCVPTLTTSLGLEFVLVPPGTFWMGSPTHQLTHPEEKPRHRVTITRPFYLGKFQVTQQQYEAVMGANPSHFRGDHPRCRRLDTTSFPVENVAYLDIQSFCHQLSELPGEQKARRRYRLPSEAEWEYACRAGTTTPFHVGTDLTGKANFNGYYPEDNEDDAAPEGPGSTPARPTPVGRFAPNLFGLFDMHGNVWEWCEDWFEADYYSRSPAKDPPGPPTGTRRVLRGGGWSTPGDLCRSALRGHNTVDSRHNYNGFRLALDASPRRKRRS